jgi:hypothetical protein
MHVFYLQYLTFLYSSSHGHPKQASLPRFLQDLVIACLPENQFTMILKDAAVKTRHEVIFFDFL